MLMLDSLTVCHCIVSSRTLSSEAGEKHINQKIIMLEGNHFQSPPDPAWQGYFSVYFSFLYSRHACSDLSVT